MKRIIVAVAITTLSLCNSSLIYAQQGAAPAAQQPAGSVPTAQQPAATPMPAIDATKLTAHQREYLLMALMSQTPATPDQLAKVKQSYEKMQPAQQTQMVQQIVIGLQQLPQATRDKIINSMPPQ